ncbi:UDP-N-acetylenolpyruvoylglucosamine reductase [Deltaproteobacteria bacterium Smac51]|nr:UDP-N-acetylenolpyruvoylglucosamine reductase [Deltaproteobacteria bacterium Smac51]
MPDRQIKALLQSILGDRASFGVPLKTLTTLGVGGPAKALTRPENVEELAAVLLATQANGLPYQIIGAGSNLLFLDEGYDGVIIKLGRSFQAIDILKGDVIKAGAAAPAHRVMGKAIEAGLGGLECLSGIPCSLGGALAMNAGAGDSSIGDVITRIFYITADGKYASKNRDELDIQYRRMKGLPQDAVILGAEFQLAPVPVSYIKSRVDELADKRSATQPKGVRSAGCFFKNPPGESAGRMIDECGLKGASVGGAMVSGVHANFIVNTGEARASDIVALMNMIIEKVEKKYGVTLETEVKIIGSGGEVE